MPEGPPALTRRSSADPPDCWHIYYCDVQAGTIAMRAGNPHDTDPWEWSCGFYRGRGPAESSPAHRRPLSKPAPNSGPLGRSFWRTAPTPIQAWRYQRDSTAWKYAMWDARMKLPTQLPTGRSKCFCGADLTINGVTDHVRAAHGLMETT